MNQSAHPIHQSISIFRSSCVLYDSKSNDVINHCNALDLRTTECYINSERYDKELSDIVSGVINFQWNTPLLVGNAKILTAPIL